MNQPKPNLAVIVALGLLAVCLVGISSTVIAESSASSSEWHVCPAGPPTCDFDEVQAAVDAAADGDVIKVAEGTYTGVHVRNNLPQVVYIDKPVDVRGGYTVSDWTKSNPTNHPTTLDAGEQGRVMVISGTHDVTVAGLNMTGGFAEGLGGAPDKVQDAGGGVYVRALSVTLSSNNIYSNTARNDYYPSGYGGGLFMYRADDAVLDGNSIHHNWGNKASHGSGGGVYMDRCHRTLLKDNVISDNVATYSNGLGGGLYMSDCDYATLENNAIRDNTTSMGADAWAGGLYLNYCPHAKLTGNTFSGNVASHWWGYGGGMVVNGGVYVSFEDNLIQGNKATIADQASGWGGGAYIQYANPVFTNTVIIDNQANTAGGGLYVVGASPRLLHSTISNNVDPEAGVVAVSAWWYNLYSNVEMTNTIISSHTVGISVTQSSTVTVHATLWHDNATDWLSAGVFHHTLDRTGDPLFDVDGYHLTESSAAIDRGVDAGVTQDIDGEDRPQGATFDLGADERLGKWAVYLPLVVR